MKILARRRNVDRYQIVLWEQLEDLFGTPSVPTPTPRPSPKLSPRLRPKPRPTPVSTLRPRPTPALKPKKK